MERPSDLWLDPKDGGGYIHLASESATILSFGPRGAFTIELWCMPSESDVPLFGKFNTNVRGEYKAFIDLGGKVVFHRGRDTISSTEAVPCGDWSHIACCYDGESMSICINGNEVACGASGDVIPDEETVVHIGTWYRDGNLGKVFKGSMKELRFWDCARGERGVRQLMHEILAERGREEESLVGYWRLQEGGGRLVEDLSKSGIEGYLISDGGGWMTLLTTSLHFDGTTGYIQVPSSVRALSFTGREPFGIEVWVKPEKSDGPVIGKFNTHVKGEYKLFIDSECKLCFYREAPPFKRLTTDRKIPLFVWSHIAAVYDGEEMRILINGKEAAHMASGSLSSKDPTSETVHIATWQRSGEVGRKFRGMMRELRIWGKPLEPVDILRLMCRAVDGQEEDLLAYWPLEGGAQP
jgi:hypothetical protein